MYKLIRRISSSFFPRPDRPWSEDATSTAPQIGRKRRLSTPEPDDRESTPSAKRLRTEPAPELDGQEKRGESPLHLEKEKEAETEEVKEVTKGVREVELEDGELKLQSPAAENSEEAKETEAAAAVPLPDSPELKAIEGKSADAEGGEADADADADTDAEGEAEAEMKEGDDVATAALSVEDQNPSTPVIEDEVPGLTLTKTTEKPVATTTATTTAKTSAEP